MTITYHYSSIVDQDIQPSMFFHKMIFKSVDTFLVIDIQLMKSWIQIFFFQFFHCCFSPPFISWCQINNSIVQLLAKRPHNTKAYAFVATCYLQNWTWVKKNLLWLLRLFWVTPGVNCDWLNNGALSCTFCHLRCRAVQRVNRKLNENGTYFWFAIPPLSKRPFQIESFPSCKNEPRIAGWKLEKSDSGSRLRCDGIHYPWVI